MKKGSLIRLTTSAVAGAALVAALSACGSSGGAAATTTAATTKAASSAAAETEFDAAKFYTGKWRASVDVTGNTVYGTAGGKEQMLDLDLAEDGTCTVTPLEGHEDLLTASGTWEAKDDKSVTITIDGAGSTELTTVDDSTLEGDPAFFKIDGFDKLDFTLY